HFDLARQRRAGQSVVTVVPLPSSQQGCDMAVMTVAADMAFIVDTVLMAIRDTEAAIDWIMHPMLRLRRDDSGQLTSIEGGADQSDHGDEESLVYVEFSAPLSFDGEALAASIRSSLADLAVVVSDFQPMRARLQAVAAELDAAVGADNDERSAV